MSFIIESKNKNIQEYQFRRQLFSNFSKFNFEPLYFLKLFPIFDKLTLLVGIFERIFLGGMLILDQKPYLLGPTIFEISQPN